MPDPCYVAYDACVTLTGGKPVMVPTNQETNFEIDAAGNILHDLPLPEQRRFR